MVQIEINIDETCTEPKITITTDKMRDELNEIVKRVTGQSPSVLVGFHNNEACVLDPEAIIRVYAANQKVYAVTDDGEYAVRLRIYELEERLPRERFVRISSSEIINLKKVKGFDLGFSGTICVKFCDGASSFVSRRYVAKIKQVLGV